MFSSKLPKIAGFAAVLLIAACGQTGSSNSINGNSPQNARLTKSIDTKFEREGNREIYFRPGSSSLGGTSRQTLDSIAAFIIDNPRARFRVVGHGDATGSEQRNRSLAMQRARTTAAYLIGKGVSFMQLDATMVADKEKALIQPVAAGTPPGRVVVEVFNVLDAPVQYQSMNGRHFPISPEEAVNSPQNVCSGGGLAGACGSAELLGLMNLEANAKISRDLRVSLGLNGSVDPSSPQTAASGSLTSNVGSTTSSVTGSVGGAVGGAVGGTVGAVGGAVGGLLGG